MDWNGDKSGRQAELAVFITDSAFQIPKIHAILVLAIGPITRNMERWHVAMKMIREQIDAYTKRDMVSIRRFFRFPKRTMRSKLTLASYITRLNSERVV